MTWPDTASSVGRPQPATARTLRSSRPAGPLTGAPQRAGCRSVGPAGAHMDMFGYFEWVTWVKSVSTKNTEAGVDD